jgi:quinoprotein glucose dehydrogenase
LTTLHQTTERIYILESIVEPNAVIAPGFQNVLLTLKSGETVAGILSFETEDEVVITSVVDGKKRKVPAGEIKERTPLPSAMPPGFGVALGKRAIRDLVQFLATME